MTIIGLGEDGPTHQPVEHLPALRAIPNLLVFRPADAVETAECWELALKSKHRPSMFALTRQKLPTVRTEHTAENLSRQGRLHPGARRWRAAGDHLRHRLRSRDRRRGPRALQAEGIGTAVVSMPSWELFEEQDEAYQDEVIGENTVRIAVEAQIRQGWDRYIGRKGASSE